MEPLFQSIAHEHKAYAYFDGNGAGQFVKMVHNGIEYGMMQAIAEGFTVMKETKEYNLDIITAAWIYQQKSVIESRLIQWTLDGLHTYGVELADISGSVKQSGEGLWTTQTAKDMHVPVPVIEDSVRFRSASQETPSFTGRLLNLMRTMFGGHEVKA